MKRIFLVILLLGITLSQCFATTTINVGDGWHAMLWNESAGSSDLLGPYVFTSSTQVVVTVADYGYDFEAYNVFDYGGFIGSTSVPSKRGVFIDNPDSAEASAQWSHGQFTIGAGSHAISGLITSTGPGDNGSLAMAFVRVDALGSQPQYPLPTQLSVASTYKVGVNPVAIAVGDLNRDGNLDIVTANDSTSDLSILLGDGAGGFTFKTNYVIGTVPQGVAIGDFDGDGIPDMAANRAFGNQCIIFHGNGDGSFAAPTYQNLNASASGGAVVVADFNNDKHLDFAAVISPVGFSVGAGKGDGTFSNAVPRFMNSDKSVVVGDFNNDGKLDAAIPYSSGKYVSIVLGNGDGTFATATNFNVPSSLSTSAFGVVAVADLNHDGNLDMVVAQQAGTNDISVFLGDGTGKLTLTTNYGYGFGAVSIALGDLNADKFPDLIVGSGTNVYVMLGNGDGTFGPRVNFPVANSVEAVAVADVNNDGLFDIITANASGTINVLLNQTFPRLQVGITGGQTVLKWPTWASGFQLQSSTNCTQPGSWGAVAQTPTVTGSQYAVTNSIDTVSKFYRLIK